jgi:hypothetical protein
MRLGFGEANLREFTSPNSPAYPFQSHHLIEVGITTQQRNECWRQRAAIQRSLVGIGLPLRFRSRVVWA